MSSEVDTRRLKPKQRKALFCLVAGMTVQDTAAELRVSEATVYAWRKLPLFQVELEALQGYERDKMLGTLGALQQKVRRALEQGLEATDAEGNPLHSIRTRTALGVVNATEAYTRRVVEQGPVSTGPLIVLPPGTARMALSVSTDAPRAMLPALPSSEPIDVTAIAETTRVPAAQVDLEGDNGMPGWFRGPRR